MEGTHAGVQEEFQPMVRAHTEKLVEGCLLWEAPHTGSEKECEESSPSGERSSRDRVWWTDPRHHFLPHWALGGENREKTGGKVEPSKMGGVEESAFKIWFYFFLYYCDLMGYNLINFPESSLFCLMAIGELSLPRSAYDL